MNTSLDCIPCIIGSFVRLIQNGALSNEEQKNAMRSILKYLAEVDYNQSPPVLGKKIHQMMREMLNNPDPYKEIKIKYNNLMLEKYDEFEEKVRNADDPFDTAMRLAIAGNVIDFGPKDQMDFMGTINKVLNAQLAIDDSLELKDELQNAKTLMYIGDNCGEIVFDKLFLKTINVPNIYYVVRKSPVLNDVTIEDAEMVGIDKIAKVITTGDNAPGAVWETTSNEFKSIFNKADVIISKGQGNLEGLLGVDRDIYFLLVTKCELIGKLVGTHKGEFIITKCSKRFNNGKVTSEEENI